MDISLDTIKQELKDLCHQHFISQINFPLQQKLQFSQELRWGIRTCLQNIPTAESKLAKVEEVLTYKERISQELDSLHIQIGNVSQNWDYTFKQYSHEIVSYYAKYPKTITQIQAPERFRFLAKDGWGDRFVKSFKIPTFHLMRAINGLQNTFRKEKVNYTYWTHTIPIRRMIRFYFFDELAKKSLDYFERVYEKVLAVSELLHGLTKEVDIFLHEQCFSDFDTYQDWEKQLIEFETAEKQLQELIDFNAREIDLIFEQVFERFAKALNRVDTLELQSGYFTFTSLSLKHQKVNDAYGFVTQGWSNKLFVLFEDWRFDQDIFTLRYKMAQLRLSFTQKFEERINEVLLPKVRLVKLFLEAHQERLKEIAQSESNYIEQLEGEKKVIDKELNKELVANLRDLFQEQSLPAFIDQIIEQLSDMLHKLVERKTLVVTDDFDKELENKDIMSILPMELVEFEILPKLTRSVQKSKAHIVRKVQRTEQTLSEIAQIAQFNIDSVIELSNDKQPEVPRIQEIIQKGVLRDIAKVDEIRKDLEKLPTFFKEKLHQATKHFSEGIVHLTEHDHVVSLKELIGKQKAKEQTKRIRRKFIRFLKNIFPSIKKGVSFAFQSLWHTYISVRERYGLNTITPQNITIEVADFLSQTQQAINKLPYVYQRLFRVEPLDNKSLFVGREQELNKLGIAYDNWLNGRFAPSVLVAEKGGGATSLINFFIQRVKPQYRLIRIHKMPHIHHPSQFVQFFKEHLPSSANIDSFEDLVQYFLKLPRKHIVIIENIEHLYLRGIDGFICLKMYLELLSKTNRNVFWLNTCSIYTWQYLDKSQNIADFYGYIVYLRKLNNNEIKEIILKRHQMSGFDIKYEPFEKDLKNKKFQKLSNESKQQYLEQEYFEHLGRFVQGNLSLAFLFWLRSTKKVVNDTISIASLKELDFSFLEAITTEKIFALNMILLHGGLTEEIMAKVTRTTAAESRLLLLLLLEDGIIVQNKNNYELNPLLYRQTINLLMKKNIIH